MGRWRTVIGNSDKHYYEQKSLWDYDYHILPSERQRLNAIIETMPEDIDTLMDIGCGNGFFINELTAQVKKTIGVDLSFEALRHVKKMCCQADVECLPIKSMSADMVTMFEVLEHLHYNTYCKIRETLPELTRKYIMISVPNEQELDYSLVTCPKCRSGFNPRYHLRSFNADGLKDLFKGFKVLSLGFVGPWEYSYHRFFLKLRYGGVRRIMSENTVCPNCGYTNQVAMKTAVINRGETKRNEMFELIMLPKRLFRQKKRRWILALYQKM